MPWFGIHCFGPSILFLKSIHLPLPPPWSKPPSCLNNHRSLVTSLPASILALLWAIFHTVAGVVFETALCLHSNQCPVYSNLLGNSHVRPFKETLILQTGKSTANSILEPHMQGQTELRSEFRIHDGTDGLHFYELIALLPDKQLILPVLMGDNKMICIGLEPAFRTTKY